MKIQKTQVLKTHFMQNKNAVAFTATPNQILKVVNDPRITGMCIGKKAFVNAVADFFNSVETKVAQSANKDIKQLDIKLGKLNTHLPQSILSTQADMVMWKGSKFERSNPMSVQQMDEMLHGADDFKCSPASTCGCGAGKSQGEFVKDLLIGISKVIAKAKDVLQKQGQEILELPNPEKIELFKS